MECTPAYPLDRLKETLRDSHHLVSVIDDCGLHVWPAKRQRLLVAGIATSAGSHGVWEWAAPLDHAQVLEEYRHLFHRSVQLSGDIFMMAPEEGRHEEYARLASFRGFNVSAAAIAETPPE